MTTFIDTSAFNAVLCADDPNHLVAKEVWVELLNWRDELLCTNYVLVETVALLQNRLGIASVRAFHEDVIPFLQIEWITENQHQSAVAALLISG